MPAPRAREYQKTCGLGECKREWHRKKCAEWNKGNAVYFKALYLSRKLTDCGDDNEGDSKGSKSPCINGLAPASRRDLKLPRREVQEVTGAKLLVIIEYFGQLLIKCIQEAKRVQPIENKDINIRLLPEFTQEVIANLRRP
jgi:hypothetical protein